MKIHVVAMRDIKTNSFGPPQHVNHLGSAIRAFEDQCKGKIGNDSTLSNHPEDFELYQLAIFDDNTGEFTNDKSQIAIGGNFKETGK